MERAQKVALCLDFDGTLSPIVEDPQAARPLPGIVELLGPLAERFAAVALVSGRPAAYLAEHAAARGVRYLGLYGLQEIREGQLRVDPRLKAARPAVWSPARRCETPRPCATAAPGWRIRSTRSPSHPRLADPRIGQPDRPGRPENRRAVRPRGHPGEAGLGAAAAGAPRQRRRGRRVVAESGARDVVVVGDDLGDLPAFSAVAQLAGQGHKGLRVAVRSKEAPPQLLAEADLIIEGPTGSLTSCSSLPPEGPGAGAKFSGDGPAWTMPPARATDRPPPPARRPVAARPASPTPRSARDRDRL